MVSTSQRTDYYSPGPENWSVRYADLACLRVARAKKNFEILKTAWLGTFSRCKHHIVWRQNKENSWYFAVLHFKDSAVLMVPATYERLVVRGRIYHTWTPSPLTGDKGPCLKPVYDYSSYEVVLLPLSKLLSKWVS
jgi:hypothetical protein